MFTIIETLIFSRDWPRYWTEEERGEFVAWLAANPEPGDVIPGSGGRRKVRWGRAGAGKRGGVRVIDYNQLADGRIWLLLRELPENKLVTARDPGFVPSEVYQTG